jgi:hypothetical protein
MTVPEPICIRDMAPGRFHLFIGCTNRSIALQRVELPLTVMIIVCNECPENKGGRQRDGKWESANRGAVCLVILVRWSMRTGL